MRAGSCASSTTTATIDELSRARLPAEFFADDAQTVAKKLLGCALVHRGRAGIIVETEAYVGPHDLACHARFGPTERTAVMFGPGGVSYVYLCYGIHQMFNIVTGAPGDGQAVLIRAVAPYVGLPDDPSLGHGPGKVTQLLRLDRRHDRRDLAVGELFGNGHLELSVYVRAQRATLRLTEHKTVVWLAQDRALDAEVRGWLGELGVPRVEPLVGIKDVPHYHYRPARSRDRRRLADELYRQRLRRVDTVKTARAEG